MNPLTRRSTRDKDLSSVNPRTAIAAKARELHERDSSFSVEEWMAILEKQYNEMCAPTLREERLKSCPEKRRSSKERPF